MQTLLIKLNMRDAVRIYGDNKENINLKINANGKDGCHFLMIEMENKDTKYHKKKLQY